MSRSYRKPYSAVTGHASANQDKTVARRCWRRAQEQAIRDCIDWEELIVPKRLEASYNDVWGWGRDGHQSLQKLSHNDLNPYFCIPYSSPFWTEEKIQEWHIESLERQTKWLTRLERK
jgi:hypothetical protein